MRAERVVAVAVATLLWMPIGTGVRTARACGPDFPVDLLSDRAATLGELPDGVFAREAATLVAPDHPYAVVIDDEPGGYLRTVGDPVERQLYDEGAAAFAAQRFADADARFTALLALPPAQRRHRSTWAAYMLGRIRTGASAIAAYQQVRALVDDGYLDERGLAASSLGQEARLHLDDDLPTAIRLYAQQAAIGHPDGAASLRQIAAEALSGGREHELLGFELGQRLVAAYLYTRASPSFDLTDPDYRRIWDELAALRSPAGADRLAAAAYRAGDWDLAARLAGRAPAQPLAAWVLAKLALRAGDPAGADRLLAIAARDPDGDARARVCGERAALALRDGRMVDAMTYAWSARARYPIDALYVAERVLTIPELTAFVAAREQAPSAPTIAEDQRALDEEGAPLDDDALREVLARRMMRAGAHAEALPYFTAPHRARARVFAGAMERAALATDPIDRSRAWFDASVAARVDGLEILGTGYGPDWGVFRAQYGGGDVGYTSPAAAGADEAARVLASAPAVAARYHYRYLASALAERAAEALPHQSQAFAAALCHAARDVRNVDAERIQRLYRRYVAVGPAVDFAATFGEACPEPAFERARRFLPRMPNRPAACADVPAAHVQDRSGPRALAILGLLAAVLGGAALARWLRRVVAIGP